MIIRNENKEEIIKPKEMQRIFQYAESAENAAKLRICASNGS